MNHQRVREKILKEGVEEGGEEVLTSLEMMLSVRLWTGLAVTMTAELKPRSGSHSKRGESMQAKSDFCGPKAKEY